MKKEFLEEIVEAVRNEIPEELREEMSVEVKEFMKSNDTLLHGIIIRAPGQNVVPNIYVEDCMEQLPDSASMRDIAQCIVATYLDGMMQAPDVADMSWSFEDIKDKLVIQVADASLNRDRLKDLVYKPLGNGMVMIPYVNVQEDEMGCMRCAVTKGMAESELYDYNKLFDTALENSMEKYPPAMGSIAAAMLHLPGSECTNPLMDNFQCDPYDGMYVLSTENGHMGASVLYYPGVQEKIGEFFKESYYVLPSSQHEVIILREDAGKEIDLEALVQSVNRECVSPQDILSDRVFKFDYEKQQLIEPKAPERAGEERGER